MKISGLSDSVHGFDGLHLGSYFLKDYVRGFLKFFFKRFYLFILDRGEGREKQRVRNINV